jgi:DNA helicase-2/ATP-dependent DNA helicase PcrA
MSYDDLLWNWLRLLEDEEYKRGLRARFRHVLVDEYQDTNLLQGRTVDHVCAPDGSLTVARGDAREHPDLPATLRGLQDLQARDELSLHS